MSSVQYVFLSRDQRILAVSIKQQKKLGEHLGMLVLPTR